MKTACLLRRLLQGENSTLNLLKWIPTVFWAMSDDSEEQSIPSLTQTSFRNAANAISSVMSVGGRRQPGHTLGAHTLPALSGKLI